MFIREKKINGQTYGYLVENTWNKGRIQQKVKEYLGKIIDEGETRKTETGKPSENEQDGSQLTNLRLETWDLMKDILRQHLEEKEYTTIDNHGNHAGTGENIGGEGLEVRSKIYENKKKTRVNLDTGEVTHKGKKAVIKINQGHITKNTMIEARGQTDDHATNNIQEFAKAIIHLGINTTQETILELYENARMKTGKKGKTGEKQDEKEEMKTFYY